jgi:hypothetical protein
MCIDPAEELEEPFINDIALQAFQAFRDHWNPHIKRVYYPGCRLDITPSKAFPDSTVIYVDINPQACDVLNSHGFSAIHASATEYVPEDIDVLILYNPSVLPEVPVRSVKKGGFIVANDYHNSATWLYAHGYRLVGVIPTNGEFEVKGPLLVETEDIEQYFLPRDPLKAEEDISAHNVWVMKQVNGIQKMFDNHEVLEAKIPDLIRAQEDYRKMLKTVASASREDVPRIKGHVDDLYIFQA